VEAAKPAVEAVKSTVEPAEPATKSWTAKTTTVEPAAHSTPETTTAMETTAAMTSAPLSDRGQRQETNEEKLRKLSHIR